jgi:hypothetical protein
MSISISGTSGISNSAMELVGKTSWTTNTTSVSFNFDSTKYEQYLLFWWIDHNPSWLCTTARFRTAGADITSSTYAFGTEWLGSAVAASSAGVVYNGGTGLAAPNASGGVSKSLIWLAGNGNDHDTHGWAQIIVPSGALYVGMRASSTLIQRVSGDAQTYNERAWGTETSTTSNNITGITIRAGDGGSSRRGMVSLVGIKKNPQN